MLSGEIGALVVGAFWAAATDSALANAAATANVVSVFIAVILKQEQRRHPIDQRTACRRVP